MPNERWRAFWAMAGEVFGVGVLLFLLIGFGYCMMSLPRNCREVTPRHWRCE